MKRLLFLLAAALAFSMPGDAQIQTSNSINWDLYQITGSLSLGRIQKGFYADPSAWLQIGNDSTTKGLLLPRILHLSSISGPKKGLMAYCHDSAGIVYYNGASWKKLGGGGSGGSSDWFDITSKPTTLAGFGITDATSNARSAITLTTTGTGAAAYNSTTGVLNIPTPSGGTVLPTQTGNAGKFLSTNGTNAIWSTISGGGGSSVPDYRIGNVYYLSKMGAVSDANLTTHVSGAYATNNTTVIRAAMDSATLHPNSTIVFDGAFSSRPFLIPSNTTIFAPNKNCGAILPNDSDYALPLISNTNWVASFRDTLHPILNENITIDGGTWTSHHPGTPIIFYGVRYLKTINAIIGAEGAAFAFTVYEGNHIYISNTEVYSNRDGIHFNGKVSDVFLQHLIINSEDDGISINADDIWRCCGLLTNPDYIYFASYAGGMTDFHIDDIHFNGGNYGIRMLSSKSIIDNIFVNNLHGYLTVYGINISNYTPDATLVPNYSNGRVGTIVVSNMHVNITTYNGGGENNSPIYLATSCKNIVLNNITVDSNTLAMPIIKVAQATIVIDRLSVDGLRSRDTNSNTPRPVIFMQNGSRIKNLTLRNIFIDRSSTAYVFSPSISGYYGSIDNILVDGYTQLNGAPFINTGSGAFGADPAGFVDVGRITANNVFMDKTGTSGFVKAEHLLPILTLSNFDGSLTDSGSVGIKNGDGFSNKTIPVIASGVASLPVTPVAYYNFTETGSTFVDKVGSNTLTKSSNALTGLGKFGNGVYFPTTSALITGPSSNSLSVEGGGTQGVIFGWFKIDPSNTGIVRLFGKGTASANNLEYELTYNNSTHQMILNVSSNGTSGGITSLTWSYTTAGEWTYVGLEFLGVSGGSVIRYSPGGGVSFISHGFSTYSGTGAFTVGGFVGSADEILITHNTNSSQVGLAGITNYNVSPYQPQSTNIPLEYADDTEAAAAGLPIGGEYRTGSITKRRVQ